jgi:hypothetical protein
VSLKENGLKTVQAVVSARTGDPLGLIRAAIASEILQVKKSLGVLVEDFFFDLFR